MTNKINKIIDYASSISHFNKEVEAYNKTARSCCKIMPQHKQLFQLLVSLYGIEINKLIDVVTQEKEILVPVLRVNTPALAKMQQNCVRTIYNQLSRLQLAGFITRRFRGSNTDLEITFKPQILKTFTSFSFSVDCKQLQHINIYFNNINNNTSLKGVEKSQISGFSKAASVENIVSSIVKSKEGSDFSTNWKRLEQSNSNTGNTIENQKWNLKLATTQASNLKNERKMNYLEQNSAAAAKSQSAINQSISNLKQINDLVDLLWIHAANTIYSEMPLTNSEIKKGKRYLVQLLNTGVANTNKKHTEIYNYLNGAITTQYEYFKRRKRDNKTVRVFIPSINFNPENPKGLMGAFDWYIQNMEMKKTFKEKQIKELLVKKLIMQFVNNYKKDTGKKQCSDAEMYKKCTSTIARSNYSAEDKENMLSTFASCFINQQNPNVKPINY